MSSLRGKLRPAVPLVACVGVVFGGAGIGPAGAAPPSDNPLPDELAGQMEAGAMNRHLVAMQRFSDSSDGTRAAGSKGHERSADYITDKLESAGYDVFHQEFPVVHTETLAEDLAVGDEELPINVMRYSPPTPEEGLVAPLAVPGSESGSEPAPGCEVSDDDDVTGRIVLVRRGECGFTQKQESAAQAGAVGVLVANNEEGPLNGRLADADAGGPPVGGISRSDGERVREHEGAEVTVDLREFEEERSTRNVIAETKTGRGDNVVMAGAHLDSVLEGAGINDNGTGSAALLETALALGGDADVNNTVRFAWWSAEEFGLVGSTHYMDSLDAAQQLDIALYTNFDMIGSPNAGYFVLDGDDSDGLGGVPGPEGSGQIEQVFVDYLEDRIGVSTEGAALDGRSDYAEFLAAGIPGGGLFTGAGGTKTPEQAEKWGGQAGVAYDECYHRECDDLGNVDRLALERNGAAMASVIGRYALSTEDVNGVAPHDVPDREQRAQQRREQRVPIDPPEEETHVAA